jgi:hypothetical protein
MSGTDSQGGRPPTIWACSCKRRVSRTVLALPRFKDHRIHAHHAREFDRGEPGKSSSMAKNAAFNRSRGRWLLCQRGAHGGPLGQVSSAARAVLPGGRCMFVWRVDVVPIVAHAMSTVATDDGQARKTPSRWVDDDLLLRPSIFSFPPSDLHEMLTPAAVAQRLLQKSVLRLRWAATCRRPGEISPIREKTVEVLASAADRPAGGGAAAATRAFGCLGRGCFRTRQAIFTAGRTVAGSWTGRVGWARGGAGWNRRVWKCC